MATVTRELSIVYGSTTVGGSSTDYLIHDRYSERIDHSSGEVEATVLVAATSEADMQTLCDALEQEFRTPYQRFRVILGGQTLIDWDPTTDTGFNAQPSIVKAGGDYDSARSRLYTITVRADLPANVTGDNGRRDSSVRIATDDTGLQVVEFMGTFTAVGGTSARAQYAAQIDSYVTTVLSGLSGSFDLVENNTTEDHENKVLTYRRVHRQIGFNQQIGTLDNASIRNQRLAITRTTVRPENSFTSTRNTEELLVVYDCSVDRSSTTDLETLYEGTIRPHIVEEVEGISDTTKVAIMRDAPQFDLERNRITATLVMRAYTGDVVSAFRVMAEEYTPGVELVPVWDESEFSRHVLPTNGALIRTVRTIVIRTTDFVSNDFRGPDSPLFLPAGRNARWVLVARNEERRPIVEGTFGTSPSLKLYETSTSASYVYVEQPRRRVATGGVNRVPGSRVGPLSGGDLFSE